MTTATADRTTTRTRAADRAASSAGRPPRIERENVRAWTFQSAGPRKYALQIQKASNGNPCLRLVEGMPLSDGTFRKFDLTIWSEDFEAFFRTLDEVRSFIAERNIRTPDGHKYDPNKPPRRGQSSTRNAPRRG